MKKTYNIFKAQRTLSATPVDDVVIHVADEIKDFVDLKEAEQVYQKEAEYLCEALRSALPGGTFDRLLVEMLKRKASLFVVSYSD